MMQIRCDLTDALAVGDATSATADAGAGVVVIGDDKTLIPCYSRAPTYATTSTREVCDNERLICFAV
jgi:hypothetical protein